MTIAGALKSWLGRRQEPPEPRLFVLDLLPVGSVGCEIGVWKGDFSARILEAVRPAELHLVDPWKFEQDEAYAAAYYGGKDAKSQNDMDRLFEQVKRRFRRQVSERRVQIHRASSTAASCSFQNDYFDWVYIDGNHRYEFVKQDIESYYPKVKAGGLIAGDDYSEGGWWGDGVLRAVDEFIESGRCQVVELAHAQYVLRKL